MILDTHDFCFLILFCFSQFSLVTLVQTIPKTATMEDVLERDKRKGREGDTRVILPCWIHFFNKIGLLRYKPAHRIVQPARNNQPPFPSNSAKTA